MDQLRWARKFFREQVDATPTLHPELKRSLKDHPRTNVFLENLATQMVQAQAKRAGQGKPPWTGKQMREGVGSVIAAFLSTVEFEANKRVESDLQKLYAQQKAQDQADLEATASGRPQGIFKELGVRTVHEGVFERGAPGEPAIRLDVTDGEAQGPQSP